MIKKSFSIVFLLIYLGIIYMPYTPYIYHVVTSDNFSKEQGKAAETTFSSNMPLLGDICYLQAIKERANNNVPENTKELPDVIVQNNMEYLSEYGMQNIVSLVKIKCDYIEYSSIIKNLILEVDSPPPELS